MSPTPFVLGVNYWPRRKAMYWWPHFDPAEVRDDFTLIRELNLRLVRIFLLWEDWQPEPDGVSKTALADLCTVCDLAAELDLQLNVTFFTGHMSGPSWAPGWLLRPESPMPPRLRQVVSRGRIVNCDYANPFSDPLALQAAVRLLEAVVGRLHDHPAIGLWNLGNEPDLFAWPPDAAAGRAWIRRMVDTIRRLDPIHPITCGLHTNNLIEDNGLRVHEVFSEVDVAVMHGYPMYCDWAAGPLDPDFAPYLCALTSALCGKPTLMEEFGGCTTPPGQPPAVWEWQAYGRPQRQFMASEEDLAGYLEQTLPRLVNAGALGALVWCFADYIPELYDRPPCEQSQHERFFGLLRPDGSLKPHAEVLRRFAAAAPDVQPGQRPLILPISPEEYYRAPLENARQFYRVWKERL